MSSTKDAASGEASSPACRRCRELEQEIACLKEHLREARQVNQQLADKLEGVQEELACTQEKLANCLHELYGPSSERVVGDDASAKEKDVDDPSSTGCSASDDSEASAASTQNQGPDSTDDSQSRSADGGANENNGKGRRRNRTNHGPGKLPDHLERRSETHDVPEDERVCPNCGGPMVPIGEDKTERVDIQPPEVYVRQVVRPKYVCPNCNQSGVKQAPAPPSPKAGSRFDFQFVTYVTVSKFSDHLPIYRQQDLLARLGLEIPRSTLDGVLTTAADLLTPLVEHVQQRLLSVDLLGVDDTPVKLIRKKTCEDDDQPSGCQTARMWVYHGFDEAPYEVFDFCLNREQKGPAMFLKDFCGYVKADAFGTEEGVYLGGGDRMIASGCWAHARRKFVEARSGGRLLADVGLDFIRELYDIEDAAKDLSPQVRQKVRQEQAAPVLERLHEWAQQEHPRQLPKRSITLALGYLLNQWAALLTYLLDGRIPIDNTATERTIRPFTIGRNNWLFFASERGGHRAAKIITVLHSAHRHCLDEMAYLRMVLEALATQSPSEALLDSLLPDAWAKSHPEHVRSYRLREREQQQAAQRARREERRGFRMNENGIFVPT